MAYYNGKKVMAVVDYKPAILIEKEITKGGEYNASDDNADGYSKVVVGAVKPEGNPLQYVIDNQGGDGKPSCYYLFYKYQGTSLDSVLSAIDTSSVTNMSYMFSDCKKLTNIPELYTSNVTDMSYMFNNCNLITSIPELDTSRVTNMTYMFYTCVYLTSIPQLDTSNVTNMSYMFCNCQELTSIPQLDTSNVTDMSSMFSGCSKLTSIPLLDTSSVNNMSNMFSSCSKLTSIPQLDTSNVKNMYYMLSSCSSLTIVPKLDVSKVTNFYNIFNGCKNITSIGMYGFTTGINITQTALEHDAIVAFLNQAGIPINSSQKITLGSTKLALLSDEEKAIATNKGWTLA